MEEHVGTWAPFLLVWGSAALFWTLVQDGAQEPTERWVCVCWARVVRKIRVCLTDTRGSFSSDNNSLMNVCARKGIRAAAAMNCETHQSRYWSDLKQQSDKHRSDVRNGKASSCSDGGRLPPRMFSGLIIEGLLPLIICSTSVHLKSIWII